MVAEAKAVDQDSRFCYLPGMELSILWWIAVVWAAILGFTMILLLVAAGLNKLGGQRAAGWVAMIQWVVAPQFMLMLCLQMEENPEDEGEDECLLPQPIVMEALFDRALGWQQGLFLGFWIATPVIWTAALVWIWLESIRGLWHWALSMPRR